MSTNYPLGTSDLELERLAFQHEVWGARTRAFLDRMKVGAGMRVLDLGCGPGFVALELAERVGLGGTVLAVDESERWIAHVEGEVARRNTANVRVRRSRVEELTLEPASLDVVFARWVFSFLGDPEGVARTLARSLRPGGVLLIQDYNHEGISVFPKSRGFDAVVRATRAMYAGSGGDVWIAGRAARVFAAAGLEMEALDANVMCGGPSSPAFQWADRFFPHFAGVMAEKGILEMPYVPRIR